jgi:hypothetical protein
MKYLKNILYKIYLLFIFPGRRNKNYFTGKEKSFIQRFIDLFLWLLRDDQFNHNYYALGLNLKGKKQKDIIGRKEFLESKHKAEIILRQINGSTHLHYEVLTKDKFINFLILKSLNIPVVQVKKLIAGQVVGFNDDILPMESLFEIKQPFVLKNITLEYGEGFLLCEPLDTSSLVVNDQSVSAGEFLAKISGSIWIMQDVVKSHTAISTINSTALNTTRIVTILNGREPVYLTGFQSFATGTNKIDSWGKGAVYVGIDYKMDRLKEYGFYHPSIPDRALTIAHPDSGIIFKGYPLPFLNEAVEMCIKAHRFLYNHFIIGWDVVITDDGPLILEANEKPGMNAVQCIDGGLRKIIQQCYRNTINHFNHTS